MDLTRWLSTRRRTPPHDSHPGPWSASHATSAEHAPTPTRDGGQGLRLFRHLLGAFASLLVMAIVYLYAAAGRVDFAVAHGFALLAALGVLVFTVCIATGFNRRFADPSLTGAQMMTSGLALAYLAYAASDFRPLQLPFYMVALLFGAFRLSIRQQLAISVYFVASFAAAVAASGTGMQGMPRQGAPSGWLLTVHLALLLVLMSLIGGYVNSVRARLRTTNGKLQQALEKIERIATYDELTGLYNRRIIHQMAAKETKRAQRNGSSLCVAMLDADHFKRFNDQYGHAAGDEVLRMLSRCLQGTLRESEYVGRYGGEEFLIVLPETTPERAQAPLQRLRQAIGSAPIEGLPGDVRVTVSIGVTEHQRGEDIQATIKRADAALYQAKHEGRDRVVWAKG
jgi:diguanylate cyclase (GGDEF)-like protein